MHEKRGTRCPSGTYTWFSKHMEGPTTLAAPLEILNAKKLAGQGLLRPHLVFATSGEEAGRDQPLVSSSLRKSSGVEQGGAGPGSGLRAQPHTQHRPAPGPYQALRAQAGLYVCPAWK